MTASDPSVAHCLSFVDGWRHSSLMHDPFNVTWWPQKQAKCAVQHRKSAVVPTSTKRDHMWEASKGAQNNGTKSFWQTRNHLPTLYLLSRASNTHPASQLHLLWLMTKRWNHDLVTPPSPAEELGESPSITVSCTTLSRVFGTQLA